MDTGLRIELFAIVLISVGITLALTFFVLKRKGHITPEAARTLDAELVRQLRASHPRFAQLPEERQFAAARRVRMHPLIWVFVLGILAGFIWAALSVPALRDWIDHGGRAAALIAIPLFAIIFGGIALIRRMLIVRMLAKLPSAGD